jgi:hypothetical protein
LTLTLRRLNRSTLARQHLLAREPLDAVDAVRAAVALQAQEAPSPYIALWNRVRDFDPAALDRAFVEQAVVKTQLFRVTLHAVAAADYPAFHEAMQVTLRGARLYDRRFRSEGVTIEATDALIPELLAFTGTARSNADVEAWLEDRFGAAKPRIWWALRQYGPFVHAGSGGPWTFGPRPAYVGAHASERPGDAAASGRYLVRRYLEGFGPASMNDIAAFTTIYKPPIKTALEEMRDEVTRFEGPGGTVLYDLPGAELPDEDIPAPPRLLPMWDSVLLAYSDRSRMVPPAYRRLVSQSNGDLLPTLLVDGFVAGVWRVVDGGIEASAFEHLPDEAWAGLEDEARALLAFLGTRDTAIYRRYWRWWEGLPVAEVRVLR